MSFRLKTVNKSGIILFLLNPLFLSAFYFYRKSQIPLLFTKFTQFTLLEKRAICYFFDM